MKQLLTTKLFMPALRPSVVERPHLMARLEEGRSAKLTLVSAPAGFGKTTLIAQWLAQITDADCCWLSLDASDNAFSRFVTYLIAALQQIQPQLGISLLSMLQEASLSSVEEVMTTLINQLTAAKLADKQFIVVLDDYHLISEEAIHRGLTFLLTYMPPELHLVLISRSEPPFPLMRWRARGLMSEIHAPDLRFSQPEASDFLNQVMNLKLTSAEVAILDARTEGWIASLQLAGLAIQSASLEHPNRQRLIAAFGGRDRYVADYLLAEVLLQQSAQIQRFLLETAPLGRLSASLCDYVRGGEGSQAILEQLEAANLFIVPLDHQRCWYRYHHLFADLLHHRLQQTAIEQIPALHQRASEWYEQHGFVEEAISHALSAKAYIRAAQLIEQRSHQLFSEGKMESLRRWMSEIPHHLVGERPHLYLLQGWLFFRTGQFRLLEAHLQHPLPTDEMPLTDTMRGEWIILQAHLAFIQGAFEHCLDLTEQAFMLTSPDNLSLRMPTMTLQAWSYEAQDDIAKAIASHINIFKIAQQANSLTAQVASLGKLVQFYAIQGDHLQARATFEHVMHVMQRYDNPQLPLLGLAYIGMGQLLYQEGKTEAAKEQLQKGIERCQRWGGLAVDTLKAYLLLAEVWQSEGNKKQALHALSKAKQYTLTHHLPPWAMQYLDNARSLAPTSPPLLDPLTPREQEILHLMAKGLSSPKIAQTLIVGVSTVRSHIKHIYSKLDAHSRHEAISKAKELGLV